jgi:hypothetical protein
MTAVAPPGPRRFTLFDSMVLVAAVGVGSKWVHEYQQSMAYFANSRPGVLSVTRSITMRYFTLAGPFLASLMLAASGLRFLRPRPTHRRLLRSSSFIILGFLDGTAVLETSCDAGSPEGFVGDFLGQANGLGPEFTHPPGVDAVLGA